MAKQQDLTFGEDLRGDYAFFIKESHFKADGWELDDEARNSLGDGTHFFRGLDAKGNETNFHGWIDNGEVVQHG